MSDTRILIKKIQNDIINPQVGLESIILKAQVLAHYLQNNEIKKWVKNELNGYLDKNDIPDYRIISTPIMGTFSNGVYIHSRTIIPLSAIPSELREQADKTYIIQGVVSLEKMAKQDSLRNPLPGDWVNYYNIFNAKSLSQGHYQLTEAYRPLTGFVMSQILGTIRNRLLEFVLEICNLSWDMLNETPPAKQIDRIFQIVINNNLGQVNMPSFQQKDGDIYNVGQAGSVGKYAISNNNTFIQSEQKQTLAEAAAEIQKLLKQLEQENPSATQSEMVSYVNDETTPSLKRRTSAALQALGETAFDEFVLENKYLKVFKATVKGWLQADS